ncbi:MAG TPA: hypothetical protein VIV11_11855 [Kofleriaceae bacterium]
MGTERVESQGHFEMLWDCDHCDTKGLLAKSQRYCAECGAPQSAVKRYFPKPEDQKKVDGHVYEGADRQCPACNAPMGAKAKACTQCGSPLDGSAHVQRVQQAAPPPKKRRRIWPYIVAGIVLIIVAIWFFFIRTRDAQLEVAAHRWERSIAIEQFGEHQESAWQNEAAKDGTAMRCVKKERSRKQVADGEECKIERVDKGDGTFEQLNKCKPKYRSEPVEDDWCTYTVRRWKKVDEVVAKGDGMTPTWPASVPPSDGLPLLGTKRAGARTEKLVLDFGKGKACAVPEATWKKLADGQKVKIEVRARSGDLVCDTIQPK